jgi:hypothetical protein
MNELNKYASLYSATKLFILETCQALNENDIPTKVWNRLVQKDNGVELSNEIRTDYSELIMLLRLNHKLPGSLNELVKLIIETPELANRLLKDAGCNPITDVKMSEWWLTNTFMGPFLQVYFTNAKSIIFNEEVFNIVFQRLIKDIESATRAVKDLSPLINARLIDCDRIEITPNIIIRRLTNDELEKWLNEYTNDPYFLIMGGIYVDITQLNCAIEANYIQNKYDAWNSPEYQEDISNLLTTLRIITDKSVHISFTEHQSDNMLSQSGGRMSTLRPRIRGEIADITPSMQQNITSIWKGIKTLGNTSRLKLALKRWDSVSERFDQFDKFIDYWIALESLFSISNSEISYRVSLRIAAMVGDTPEERVQLFKDMKASYRLRSQIVHGDNLKGDNVNDLILKTRTCLRKALLMKLTGQSFDPESLEINLLKQFIREDNNSEGEAIDNSK